MTGHGNLLLKALPKLGVEDRVNLLSDAWALVQADRAPVSLYFGLVEKLPASTDLAEREQIINVLDFVNGLLVGNPERERFQAIRPIAFASNICDAWGGSRNRTNRRTLEGCAQA